MQRIFTLCALLGALAGCQSEIDKLPVAPTVQSEQSRQRVLDCQARYQVASSQWFVRQSPLQAREAKQQLRECYAGVGE